MSPVPLVCSQCGSHVEHAYLRGTEVVCKPCGFVQSLERRVTQGPRTFLKTRILTDTLAAVCKLQVLRDLGEAPPPPPPPQEDSWSFSEIMVPENLVSGSTSYSESNRRSSEDSHGVLAAEHIVYGSTSSAQS